MREVRLRSRHARRLAEWNVDQQQWVLGATYDHTFCHGCEGETRLVEVVPRPNLKLEKPNLLAYFESW